MSKKTKVFLLTFIACIVLTVGGIFAGKIATYAQGLSIIKANQEIVNAWTGDTIRSVTRLDTGSGMAVSGGDFILVGDTHEYIYNSDTDEICMFFAKEATIYAQSKGKVTEDEAKKIAEKVFLTKMKTVPLNELALELKANSDGTYLYEAFHRVGDILTGNKASIEISDSGVVLAVAFVQAKTADATPADRGEEMMNAQEAIEFVCRAIEEYEKDNTKIKSLVVHVEENYKTELDNIKGQLLWKVTIPVTAVTASGEEVKESYIVWVDAYSGASYRVAKTLNAVWD